MTAGMPSRGPVTLPPLRLLAGIAVLVVVPSLAQAAPVLQRVSPSQWTFGFGDGTSNTVLFGESTQLDVCVPSSSVPGGITDGTSNTILFGEGLGVVVNSPSIVDGTSNTIFITESLCLNDITDPLPAIGGVTDGTSNTIFVGEVIDLRDTPFDVCFSQVRVGQIVDGTSNTLLFGEWGSRCYQGVRVSDDLVVQPSVPAPATVSLLGLALGSVMAWRRARGRA